MTASRDGRDSRVPDATVARLATYLRVLSTLADRGVTTVSSEELAAAAGVNSAKLRKDLSFLGSYGIRGVGYDVTTLTEQISRTLGLTVHRSVALIGVGNLGQALAGYAGFATRGFRIAALLDADPGRIGSRIRGLVVQDIAELDRVIAENAITIAVLAVPASAAQEVRR
jgi:redox-sensing transcriptional repressor